MINKVLLTNFSKFTSRYSYFEPGENEDLSILVNDFKYILNFIKGNRYIVFSGGDPFLHPKLEEILEIANKNKELHYFFESHLILEFDRLLPKLKQLEKFSFICTLNIVEECPETRDTFLFNVRYLFAKNISVKGKLVIDKDTDIDIIIDVIKKSGLKKISWEPSFNFDTDSFTENQIEDYYLNVKQKVVKLIEFGIKQKINIYNECGNIPICLLNSDDIKLFAYSSTVENGNIYNFTCEPFIIISWDLKAFRCKAIGEYVDIKLLKNFDQLYRYFVQELDRKIYAGNIFYKCANCLIKDSSRKCGCLLFKEIG